MAPKKASVPAQVRIGSQADDDHQIAFAIPGDVVRAGRVRSIGQSVGDEIVGQPFLRVAVDDGDRAGSADAALIFALANALVAAAAGLGDVERALSVERQVAWAAKTVSDNLVVVGARRWLGGGQRDEAHNDKQTQPEGNAYLLLFHISSDGGK